MGPGAAALQQLELQVGDGLVDHAMALLAAQFADLLLEMLPSGLELFAGFCYSALLNVGEENIAGISVLLKLFLLNGVTFEAILTAF